MYKNFLPISCFLAFFLSITLLPAQETNTLYGVVLNRENGKPVDFANIGFVGIGIGTVSNLDGTFNFAYYKKDVKNSDVLQISAIGFNTVELTVDDLSYLTTHKSPIFLSPRTYNLDAVVLKPVKRINEVMGSSRPNSKDVGYWNEVNGLGGEIATRIKIDKENTRLENVSFYIVENHSDSLLIRLNIYDYKRGLPRENILRSNIFHTVTKDEGKETISLIDNNIVVDDDVVVSLELVEVYGKDIYFSIATSQYSGTSYTREISQDDWKIYRKTGLSFSTLVSYPEKSEPAVIVQRPKPRKVLLYWDVSAGMANRDTKDELKLLKHFVDKIEDLEIKVVKFSSFRREERSFNISRGNARELIDYLETNFYDGSSGFSILNNENEQYNADLIWVSTNGDSKFDPFTINYQKPIFIVNSLQNANHRLLQDVSILSGGYYFDVTWDNPRKIYDNLFKEIEDDKIYQKKVIPINNQGYVHGRVSSNNRPIGGAIISIKDSYIQALTNQDGLYSIPALPNHVLNISALGMKDEDTVVSGLKEMNFQLKPKQEILEEVRLTGKNIKNEFVTTPYGKIDKNAVGYSITNTFTNEDINNTATTLTQVLRGKAGIIVDGYEGLGDVKFRFQKTGRLTFTEDDGKTYPIVVIDDLIYDQRYQKIPNIDPQTITNITLLKSLNATNKYGSIAAFGAIVIYTNIIKEDDKISEKKKKVLTNENYFEDKNLKSFENWEVPNTLLKKVYGATTYIEAKQEYVKLVDKNRIRSIKFYVDASDYFLKWDTSFSNSIISNIAHLAHNSSKALKTLAFKYEERRLFSKAEKIYEEILKLESDKIQPYIDLANIYSKNEKVEEAYSLYKNMYFNEIESVDFQPLAHLIKNDFKRFISLYRNKIDVENIPSELLIGGFKYDYRITVEWTDSNTDFELQFVDPQKRYIDWDHTEFLSKERLFGELRNGFSSEEFIIDDAQNGDWLVTFKGSFEESVLLPTYLKYTVFENYGTREEKQQIKILPISSIKEKIILDTITIQ